LRRRSPGTLLRYPRLVSFRLCSGSRHRCGGLDKAKARFGCGAGHAKHATLHGGLHGVVAHLLVLRAGKPPDPFAHHVRSRRFPLLTFTAECFEDGAQLVNRFRCGRCRPCRCGRGFGHSRSRRGSERPAGVGACEDAVACLRLAVRREPHPPAPLDDVPLGVDVTAIVAVAAVAQRIPRAHGCPRRAVLDIPLESGGDVQVSDGDRCFLDFEVRRGIQHDHAERGGFSFGCHDELSYYSAAKRKPQATSHFVRTFTHTRTMSSVSACVHPQFVGETRRYLQRVCVDLSAVGEKSVDFGCWIFVRVAGPGPAAGLR
jgi:hypothetical protein